MPSATTTITARESWESIRDRKLSQRDSLLSSTGWLLPFSSPLVKPVSQGGLVDVTSVPAQSGILTSQELEITETDGHILVGKLKRGEVKSVDVVRAFCKRATIAHQLTNCLTEVFFSQALTDAALADAHLLRTGEPLGPLHGLPVSLKDNFEVHGLDTSIGFVAWVEDPCVADEHIGKAGGGGKVDGEEGGRRRGESEMTKIMRRAGAVLFCKTNVPTAMMIAESYNNVWGYTLNPLNRNLSSGGSSGGESALLAMKGSPLGVGTDIGGSIRIPASFCNLYGLKPSYGRFSTTGARSGLPGQEAVLSTNGPMSTSLDTIKLWSETVVRAEHWNEDPKVLPIPWRDVRLPERLSIGIVYDDGLVTPHPPIQRGLREVARALEEAGHEVITFKPYEVMQAGELLKSFFLADGGTAIRKNIAASGEPWPQGLVHYQHLTSSLSASDLWEVQVKRNAYVAASNKAWNEVKTSSGRPLDGVIAPVSPYPGCLHHTFEYGLYSVLWNLLDQTSCTFPVTRADPAKDAFDHSYTPLNPFDEKCWKSYDPERHAGGAVALQLIGKRLEEEKVLAMTEVIAAVLKAQA